MIYRECQILKTTVQHADSGKPLYDINGRLSKAAARRPFLSSVEEAKEWIDTELTADEAAP